MGVQQGCKALRALRAYVLALARSGAAGSVLVGCGVSTYSRFWEARTDQHGLGYPSGDPKR